MFFAIGFDTKHGGWVIGSHKTAAEAAGQSMARSMAGGWIGLCNNNAPWTQDQAIRAVDMLHNSLVSNIADSEVRWLAWSGGDLKIGRTNPKEA